MDKSKYTVLSAKFIGESSCGFKTDQKYHIVVYIKNNLLTVQDIENSKSLCMYSSLGNLLHNWIIK